MARTRKKHGPRMQELHLDLRVPKKQFKFVDQAINSVLQLAGATVSLASDLPPRVATEQAKAKAAPGRRGRPRTVNKIDGAVAPRKKTTAKTKPSKPRRPKTYTAPKRGVNFPNTAAIVKSLRTEAGLSQKKLADSMGVYQHYISAIESGKKRLTPDLANKLSAAFGQGPEKFLNLDA